MTTVNCNIGKISFRYTIYNVQKGDKKDKYSQNLMLIFNTIF